MLEKLKAVFFEKDRDPHEKALAKRIERSLTAMPPATATKAWRGWLWSLPSEAREEAVFLRGHDPARPENREAAVRAITRLSRSGHQAEVEPLRTKMQAEEKEFHERAKRFATRWGEPPKEG